MSGARVVQVESFHLGYISEFLAGGVSNHETVLFWSARDELLNQRSLPELVQFVGEVSQIIARWWNVRVSRIRWICVEDNRVLKLDTNRRVGQF